MRVDEAGENSCVGKVNDSCAPRDRDVLPNLFDLVSFNQDEDVVDWRVGLPVDQLAALDRG